jgi:hypothetical protein
MVITKNCSLINHLIRRISSENFGVKKIPNSMRLLGLGKYLIRPIGKKRVKMKQKGVEITNMNPSTKITLNSIRATDIEVMIIETSRRMIYNWVKERKKGIGNKFNRMTSTTTNHLRTPHSRKTFKRNYLCLSNRISLIRKYNRAIRLKVI